jgi:putative transposase
MRGATGEILDVYRQVLVERSSPMALPQSAVSELLEALRTTDGLDLVKEFVRLVLQEPIEAEAVEHFGAARYQRTQACTGERNGAAAR